MTNLVRAELLKLTGRRLTYGLFGLAVAYLSLTLVLVPVLARFASGELGSGQDMAAFLGTIKAPIGYVFAANQSVTQASLFVVILSSIAVANEYSWGTITLTLVLEPRRTRVLVAKILALAGLSIVGTVALFVLGLAMVAAVQLIIPAGVQPVYLESWLATALAAFGLGLPSLIVWVAVAVFLAVLTRSPGAAAGIAVAFTISEGILQVVPQLQPALISANTQALQTVALRISEPGIAGAANVQIPPWRAALVLAIWALAAFAATQRLLARRDVT